MATQLNDDDQEETDFDALEYAEADDEPEGAESDDEDEDGDEADDDDADSNVNDADDDEDVITLGGAEAKSEDEPVGLRNVREWGKREQQRADKLEAELRAIKGQDEALPDKPKMDDYWDADDPDKAYEDAYTKWQTAHRQVEERKEAERKQQEAAQKEWDADLATFEQQRSGLRVRDFEPAYDRVTSELSDVQRAILVQVGTHKAALAYALGKNPDKLAEIKGITNPVKFTAAVVRLDMETTVQKRKPTTTPESVQRGSGASSGRGDAKMERLERDAIKTGDRTALIAYKRQLREKEAARA